MSTPFENDLAKLLNSYSMESGSDTPDFVLAKYLQGCLDAFNAATVERSSWYGKPAADCGSHCWNKFKSHRNDEDCCFCRMPREQITEHNARRKAAKS